jgi:hypothetical protein
LPTSLPPTSFDTHVIVMSVSIIGRSAVGVGELDLVVDHAVDAQRPVLGRDLGDDEGGVDAVEGDVRVVNGVRPGTSRSTPAGTAAAPVRRGSTTALREPAALKPGSGSARSSRHRCEGRHGHAGGDEPPAVEPPRVGSARCAAVRPSGRPLRPATKAVSATMPTRAPTMLGRRRSCSTRAGERGGRAHHPEERHTGQAEDSRRAARMPRITPNTASSTTMPTTSATLSFVPNVAMAKSLTGAARRR